eukprot:1181904-Prorocentrum_minimum.AAC.3
MSTSLPQLWIPEANEPNGATETPEKQAFETRKIWPNSIACVWVLLHGKSEHPDCHPTSRPCDSGIWGSS